MSGSTMNAVLASVNIGLAAFMFSQGHPFSGAFNLAVGVFCVCVFAIQQKRCHG